MAWDRRSDDEDDEDENESLSPWEIFMPDTNEAEIKHSLQCHDPAILEVCDRVRTACVNLVELVRPYSLLGQPRTVDETIIVLRTQYVNTTTPHCMF